MNKNRIQRQEDVSQSFRDTIQERYALDAYRDLLISRILDTVDPLHCIATTVEEGIDKLVKEYERGRAQIEAVRDGSIVQVVEIDVRRVWGRLRY
jgi:hypothetical protein